MNLITSESTSKARQKRKTVLLSFIAIASFLAGAAIQRSDLQISNWARQRKFSGDLEKAIQLSEAFAHGSGVVAIFLVLIWVDIRNRKRLWNVAGYVLFVGALANIAKYFMPRLRPNSGIEIVDIRSTWLQALTGIGRKSSELAFPSGHSATAVALAIALTIIYPRGKWFFATLAIMAVWQRIYSGAHYPTDCLAGVSIAASIACLWRWPAQTEE